MLSREAHLSTGLAAQFTERAASALVRALVEVVELLMRQSASLRKWNQTKPVTSGCVARQATGAVFHFDFDPPTSDDEVSAIIMGFPGASARSCASPVSKRAAGACQRLQPAEVPQLYPSSATASTYAAPGYKPASGVEPVYGTFGLQTQDTLVAPAAVTTSCT